MEPTHEFKALLCDMDGTILNSEEISHLALEQICSSYGKVFTVELHGEVLGSRFSEATAKIIDVLGIGISPEEFKDDYRTAYEELLDSRLLVKDGFQDIVDLVRGVGLRLVLVTSSSKISVERNFKIVGLDDPFEKWITAESVEHGKPDPEAYVKGADAAGVEPEECIVLEDSVNGVLSASAAGAHVIAVPTQFSNHGDFSSSNRTCSSLIDAKKYIEKILSL